ncbi:MAG: hypothetical protein K0Q76_3267 [Panacagrimonas sp.]|jgi:hypothetical protein|nr:hypothetical protein [Panacagrimonas sp.]MCC2658159.1 hypothetical protein [Panacagrimonas sp.]
MLRLTLALAFAFALAVAYALWPVCVPLSADATAAFVDPPIAERTDTMLWGRMFQLRDDGQWQQCKTRIARAFFF